MGKLGRPEVTTEVPWAVVPDVEQLNQAAEAWLSLVPRDPRVNRRFLDRFATYLVKHFRAEETRLERLRDSRIALWDVCASAKRAGSLDANIVAA